MRLCSNVTRRTFLADAGSGFTGLALGAMLFKDGIQKAHGSPSVGLGQAHLTPKAKSVIWIMLMGGMSHVESFDPKPELNKHAGKTIGTTPHSAVAESTIGNHVIGIPVRPNYVTKEKLLPMTVGYKRYGQSGLEISDWWPHLGSCADDLAVVRSLWTTDDNHGGIFQVVTGRHVRDGICPTIGSWISYGLGTLNQNLPEFIVLNVGGYAGFPARGYTADYLGPAHTGVALNLTGNAGEALPFVAPAAGQRADEVEAGLSLLGKLNRRSGIEYPDDPALRARIKSYELAFGMQTALPEVLRIDKETEATRKFYGIDQQATNQMGKTLLTARRLVEQGVRFIQVVDSRQPGWDYGHSSMTKSHEPLCQGADLPMAALIKDLKQRGLLQDTLVLCTTEFGRTPTAENAGRGHHPYGFSWWLAGGGIKGGTAHGATDELGFYAVENRHYITDIHATVLHQLGLDVHKLEVPGRKRLEMDFGKPIKEIIA
jgi:hypothetical protein